MTAPIGILCVGGSEADGRHIEAVLRAGGFLPSMSWSRAEDVETALRGDLVEVVIVDADSTGCEEVVRAIARSGRDLPCLAISASPSVADVARAIRAGCHDYLVRDQLDHLQLTIERELRERKEVALRAQKDRTLAAGTERLLRESLAKANSLKAMQEAARESGGAQEPGRMAQIAAERARRLVAADAVALYRWDSRTDRLERLVVDGDANPSRATGRGLAELALRTGGPVIVGDRTRLAAIAPSLAAAGYHSAIAVALVSDDRQVGALVAGLRRARGFDAEKLDLFSLFAAQIAPTLEAAWLAADRDVQVRRLEELQRIAVAAGGVLDPSELGRLTTAAARELTGGWSSALLWLEPDGTVSAVHDNHPNALNNPRAVRGEGATGMALSSGNPVLVDDYPNWAPASTWALRAGIASLVAVPLMVRDVARGCLVVRSRLTRHFKADDVRVLSLLAAQVAPAIEGARQARENEEQTHVFRALHEIAVASGGVLDPGRLSRLAVGHASELLSVDGAVVFGWDPQSGLLQPLHETESSSPEQPVRPGEGAIGQAFQLARPVVIDDFRTFDDARGMSAARGMLSAAAVPLIFEGRPVGALGVWSYTARRFRPAEIQVLSLFAAQLAPALEAARVAAESEFQAFTFRALHDVAVAAGGLIEPEALARLAVASARDLLGAQSAVLVRHDPDTDRLEPLADSNPELAREPRVAGSIGAAGIAFRERRAVAVEDYQVYEHARAASLALGVKSVLAVPILVQDVPIGCLGVRWNQRHAITPKDTQVLCLLAAEVGPSMEAARIAAEREARARALASLHDLAVAVGGVLEPIRLARVAIDHARDLLRTESAMLVWRDDAANDMRVLAESHPALGDRLHHPRGVGAVGMAFERREPVVVSDYDTWKHALGWVRELGVKGVIAVPLLIADRPVGCLVVRSEKVRDFKEADVQLLTLLAAEVAPAIHAAFLHSHLSESEQSLRAIIESAPLLIARNDLGGRVLAMNRTGLQMFGFTEEEALAASRETIFQDPPGESGMFADLVAGRIDRYRVERHYRRRDGSEFWGDTTLSLVRDESGQPDFYYSIIEDVTDRKRAADSLQQQADTFRALHELGLAAGGITEPEALADAASRKARELLGVDAAMVLLLDDAAATLTFLAGSGDDNPPGASRPFTGALAVELSAGRPLVIADYPAWEDALAVTVEAGVKSAIMVPLLVRDRVIGTLGVQSLSPRSFAAGELEMLTLVAAAIGPAIAAARLHAGLVDSEGRVRAIFETAPMVIGRIDPQGVMVEMNSELERMTGYRLDEVLGCHMDALPWAEGGLLDRAAQRGMVSGRRDRVQYEKSLLRKDGSHFWAAVTVSAVRREGAIDFFYVMLQDINESKVAEQALRESELRKTAIVNSALECVVAADSDGCIIEFNPAAERIFGIFRDKAIGSNAFDLLISPQHREMYRQGLRDFIARPVRELQTDRLESTFLRGDGSEFPVEIAASMFEQGGTTIFSASIRDLTERDQVLAVQRESEAKSRFLASMSHELRTPLNSILGFSQLMASGAPGPLTERQERYVGHIESSGRHLLALINDVLDLSKVAAGQMEVGLEDVELAPLVEEALAKIRPLADAKPLELYLESSVPVWARADRLRLLQVLLNLLSNAVKFTPSPGLVRVALGRSLQEVEISVIDTGIGIDPAHQVRIFDEFTQVQVGALDSQEGTGLGLALCRRLVALMDGTIRLQSEVGKGSVFTVALPRAQRRRDRVNGESSLGRRAGEQDPVEVSRK